MRANRRLVANILEIVVGIGLAVCGYVGIIDEYWGGMGTALIFVGCLMLLRQLRYQTNNEYKEKVDVEVGDERNKYLRMMAWSWAGYFFVIIAAICSVIFRIMGYDQFSILSGCGVFLIVILYWISYFVVMKKY